MIKGKCLGRQQGKAAADLVKRKPDARQPRRDVYQDGTNTADLLAVLQNASDQQSERNKKQGIQHREKQRPEGYAR